MEQTAAEEALEVLRKEREKRLAECQHAINEALRRYRCDLVAQPAFTPDGRVVATVRLVDVSGQ